MYTQANCIGTNNGKTHTVSTPPPPMCILSLSYACRDCGKERERGEKRRREKEGRGRERTREKGYENSERQRKLINYTLKR